MLSIREKTIAFIGIGRVGTALAVKLAEAGYRVAAAVGHHIEDAERLAGSIEGCVAVSTTQEAADKAMVVFITTSDDRIAPACRSVNWSSAHTVVHCSGSLSTDVLAAASCAGARTGSFHPCQAFADADQAMRSLPGSTFAIEADESLAEDLRKMASDLQCGHIRLKPGDKPLYHAAAVLVSNYVVTLVKVATDLFSRMEIPPDQAVKIMMPLMKGNLFNIQQAGIPMCLTGPIARGDSGTVLSNMEALRQRFPEYLGLYASLGLHTVPIAMDKGGLSVETADNLVRILEKETGPPPEGSLTPDIERPAGDGVSKSRNHVPRTITGFKPSK